MKHYESLIIGHITMDHDTDYLGNETLAIGGAVIYSSASAYALGHKVAALTKINPDDSERLTYFTIPKEDIYCIMSESSCTMDNQYFTADKERRKCMCISVGTPFTIDDIPEDVEADIYHFAGLLYGDFTNEMIIEASKRGKVAVDVQALLRHVNLEDHTMFFEDWKEKKRFFRISSISRQTPPKRRFLQVSPTDTRRQSSSIHGAQKRLLSLITQRLLHMTARNSAHVRFVQEISADVQAAVIRRLRLT